MGNVYLGCPVNVRGLLHVEKQLLNPNLSVEEKSSLEAKYLEAKLKFDGYNTEVATIIDYNRQMKRKGIDPDTLPKVEEVKVETPVVETKPKGRRKKEPEVIIQRARRLKVKTGELV